MMKGRLPNGNFDYVDPAARIPERARWNVRGLPVRAAFLGILFFLEKIFLTRFVDVDRADAALGVGEQLRVAQYFGFRFIVAFAAALTVFALARGKLKLSLASPPPAPTRLWPAWAAAHLALIACLAWLSSLLFPAMPPAMGFPMVVGLWLLCGSAAVLCAFAATAPLRTWLSSVRELGSIPLYAVAAALAAAAAIPLSQRLLWTPATAATFDLVALVLRPILPGLTIDPTTRVLGTDRFAVEILEWCSGLEGMSLMLVFTIAWLWYFRKEYYFPRALLLIPLSLALMFGLNVLRIATLTLIGNAGYPDVAMYGFHSQAGWIAFNAVAAGIAFGSQRSQWLSRRRQPLESQESDNPTAAFLMPLLAILAAGMLSHAMSGRFEWLYPIRLLACVAVLVIYRRRLLSLEWHWSWRGVLLGTAVFVGWVVGAHFLIPASGMPPELAAASPSLRWSWLGCRVVAFVMTVPIAEELAYRGFLMRRLQTRDFDSLVYQRVGWVAVVVSSVIFGIGHGAMWLPGIFAGLAYGWITRRQGQLGEAVAAHMTTNLLLAAFALGRGDWSGF
jgi:exosortase E/protease (VPEID-CTERM system)